MGAIFTVALAHVSDIGELPGARIALAADAGEQLQGPGEGELTLLVGSERDGLPAEILAACDRVARIPIATDSLNAAMAATVALYEMTRQPHGAHARLNDTVPAS
jgi:TrmH family RNA methyltransferase